MKEYVIIAVLTWVFKTFIDWGVKKSKSTKNTIDDIIFGNANDLLNTITNLFKTRKK